LMAAAEGGKIEIFELIMNREYQDEYNQP